MAKNKPKEKPGVLIYWKTFNTLRDLTPEETKKMIDAIGAYGRYKEKPNFDDRLLDLLWKQIEADLDADDERYENIREVRAEAGRKGGQTRANNLKQMQANEANATFDKQNKPITITNTNTNPNTITNTITITDTDTGEVRNTYGLFHNVFLSDEELEGLQKDYPKECEDLIERLSEYMASTGKEYNNHCATIRSWARKDKKPIEDDTDDEGLDEFKGIYTGTWV